MCEGTIAAAIFLALVVACSGLLAPFSRCLDAESARRVVEMQLDPPVNERLDLLASHANEGALDDEERDEYEALINAADFVSVLQSPPEALLK